MKKVLQLWVAACVLVACALAQTNVWQPSGGHQQIPIWPGKIPDARPVTGPETVSVTDKKELVGGKPYTYIENVSVPTITVYPARGKNTGAAVVVFPGGGFWILAIDLEGTEVCDWLTAKGITCVLLKYRVPGNGKMPRSGAYPRSKEALDDAQRAISLTRYHAAEWHIDPHKIGVLGFSAGGHLVAATSTLWPKRVYAAVDAADQVSCRPDFAVALYPGHLLEGGKGRLGLNPTLPVNSRTPPTILIQAKDDPVDTIRNSLAYYAALEKAGVKVEMPTFEHGGHAFGLRPTKEPITHWPELVEKWLKKIRVTGG